eukprot:12025364-Alexandrium_andersonii.AAC.1
MHTHATEHRGSGFAVKLEQSTDSRLEHMGCSTAPHEPHLHPTLAMFSHMGHHAGVVCTIDRIDPLTSPGLGAPARTS